MRRRRLVLWLFLLVVLACAGVTLVYWASIPTHHICMEGFKKIQLGMTRTEVQRVLGHPGESLPSGFFIPLIGPFNHDWQSSEARILVLFDAEGRVVSMYFFDADERLSILEYARRLLPW